MNDQGFVVDPAVDVGDDEFRCFWVTGDAWGTYTADGENTEVEVRYERES